MPIDDVAKLFRVSPNTVPTWIDDSLFTTAETPEGGKGIPEAEIRTYLDQLGGDLFADGLLKPNEITVLLDINGRTIGRWVRESGLPHVRTPAVRCGKLRFRESTIRQVMGNPTGPLADDPLVSIRTVIDRLGINKNGVNRLVAKRKLTVIHTPTGGQGTRRFRTSEVEAIQRSQPS